jgi:hypothetical protein
MAKKIKRMRMKGPCVRRSKPEIDPQLQAFVGNLRAIVEGFNLASAINAGLGRATERLEGFQDFLDRAKRFFERAEREAAEREAEIRK